MHETNALSEEAHRAVAGLLAAHLPQADIARRLRFYGTIPSFDSAHKLTLSAAAAIGAYAAAIEHWWHLAGGQRQVIGIDWMQAASGLNPGQFQKQSGYLLPALSLLTELKADFYRTRDDRWFFPIGSYPHLRDGVLELLQCPNTVDGLQAAIGKWDALALEEAFAERKLPGAYARTASEWREHPQGRMLAQLPAIEIEKIGDSEPEPARANALARPLEGLRVLDLGHVIAGPIVARSLAEHGADVLRITSPTVQDPFRQTIDTNIGKHSAFLDLDRAVDYQKACELISGADVVVQSWRPGSLQRRGLGPEEVARIRPGVIYVSVTAYGDQGSWGTRGGFEQLGQVVSGIAIDEAFQGKPRVVPTYLLNDYLTGYLGATGAALALIRRAKEGGSYHVKVSLTQSSMWVQSLGRQPGFDPARPRRHFAEELMPVLETRSSAYGPLEQLPPVAQFSRTRARWDLPPAPNGAHLPQWQAA